MEMCCNQNTKFCSIVALLPHIPELVARAGPTSVSVAVFANVYTWQLPRCAPTSLITKGPGYFEYDDVLHCLAQLSLSKGGLVLRRLSDHSSAC